MQLSRRADDLGQRKPSIFSILSRLTAIKDNAEETDKYFIFNKTNNNMYNIVFNNNIKKQLNNISNHIINGDEEKNIILSKNTAGLDIDNIDDNKDDIKDDNDIELQNDIDMDMDTIYKNKTGSILQKRNMQKEYTSNNNNGNITGSLQPKYIELNYMKIDIYNFKNVYKLSKLVFQ